MASIADLLFSDDPQARLVEHLRRALPSGVGVYSQTLPDRWNPNMGLAVVVADDASQVRESTFDRVLVRVSVHAPTFDLSRKYGRSIYEFLTSPIGGVGLGISRQRSTSPVVGPNSLAGGFVSTCSYSCGCSKKEFS